MTNRFGVRGSRFMVWFRGSRLAVAALILAVAAPVLAAPSPDSKRLAAAKDAIADEQWTRAVAALKAVVDDPKEPNRDEALFWLAHSQHQAGDQAGAIDTIARLERTFPRSAWVRPARSLSIEIAQRMKRDDVLWQIAVPPAPPAPPALQGHLPVPPAPAPPAPRAPRSVPPRPATPAVMPQPAFPAPAALPGAWLPEPFSVDTDLRIEALGSLLDSHPARVIPLLKEIALDPSNVRDGRRALILLAQSPRAEARTIIIEAAKTAPEPVRIAAIREMGRLDDPRITVQLMQVYSSDANPRIKREVVSSLSDRADTAALLRIARTESDPLVRNTAIVKLGRAGSREQLRALYQQASRDSRAAILTALFSARDDEELIRIASTERDPILRQQARRQLQLLGTPKAMEFLSKK